MKNFKGLLRRSILIILIFIIYEIFLLVCESIGLLVKNDNKKLQNKYTDLPFRYFTSYIPVNLNVNVVSRS